MGYYYLNLEPQNIKDLNNKYKYITISQYNRSKPEKGKKYSTKENEEYKEKVNKINKCNEAFESGIVDLHNNYIELNDFIKEFTPDFTKDTVYRIEPIESKEVYERYYSSNTVVQTNKFKIINKITSLEDLVEQLYKDNLLDKFVTKYFERTSFNNTKELNLNFFNMINQKFKDYKPCLSHMVLTNSKNDIMLELLNYYLENNLITLRHEWDNSDTEVFKSLLSCKWFELAYKYLKEMCSDRNHLDIELKQIKNSKDINVLIRTNSDNNFVKKIIEVLGIEDSFITLKVLQYDDDYEEYKPIETKTFQDMNEVKEYLIKQYDVPFSKINNDINDIYLNDISFEVN